MAENNYIQTYDFNTNPCYPFVGIGSINPADVGYGAEGNADPSQNIINFEKYIKDIIKESPSSSATFAQGIGDNTTTIGGPEKFVYVSNGKITATNASIGNSSTPIYLKDGVFTACTEMAPGGITEIPPATNIALGGIKTGYTEKEKEQNYPVVLDNNNNAYVHVPWTDTASSSGSSVSYVKGSTDLKMGQTVTLGTIIIDGTQHTIDASMPTIDAEVENLSNTLNWDTSVAIAKVNGVSIYAKLPSNPDTNSDTNWKTDLSTSKIYLAGKTTSSSNTGVGYVNASVYMEKGAVYANDFAVTSDERLKTFKDDISIDFNKIKEIPKKYFTFNDDPNKVRIGTSAQQLQTVYPELVVYDESNDSYHVNYANLSVVALAAIDRLHEEIEYLKDKINKLENGRG